MQVYGLLDVSHLFNDAPDFDEHFAHLSRFADVVASLVICNSSPINICWLIFLDRYLVGTNGYYLFGYRAFYWLNWPHQETEADWVGSGSLSSSSARLPF